MLMSGGPHWWELVPLPHTFPCTLECQAELMGLLENEDLARTPILVCAVVG